MQYFCIRTTEPRRITLTLEFEGLLRQNQFSLIPSFPSFLFFFSLFLSRFISQLLHNVAQQNEWVSHRYVSLEQFPYYQTKPTARSRAHLAAAPTSAVLGIAFPSPAGKSNHKGEGEGRVGGGIKAMGSVSSRNALSSLWWISYTAALDSWNHFKGREMEKLFFQK